MDGFPHEGCCGCAECQCAPAEFVRLRYYFGQRLGAVDLSDAQSYLVGKQRFHNRHLHGTGVLCGLRAERFVWPQNAPPNTPATVLRVIRGAALDACGREILVALDQCIDVAAWFAAHQALPELAGWTKGTQTLYVALRYRECPSDPAPAPREPCGCDTGGCEYGRIREGFELALFTETDRAKFAAPAFPTADALRAALAGLGPPGVPGMPGGPLRRPLGLLVAADCPEMPPDPWLCLARFSITLDGAPLAVTDIDTPDNAVPERRSLLSTAALQTLVEDVAAAVSSAGMLGPGPHVAGVTFEDGGADSGTLKLPVVLARDGNPPVETPLAEKTFDPATVTVAFLDAGFQWQTVTPAPAVSCTAGPPPRIEVKCTAGLAEGVAYRLTINPPFETPIVDQATRPLRPNRLARHFRLVKKNNKLELDPTL
jgi:hypothetical protein